MSDIGAILETGGAAAVELAASTLTERGGKLGHCANCAEPLLGPFCAVCGQPRNVHRRSIRHLLTDLFSDILSFDSRILRTALALLVRPGELPRAYHEGRTQPYVPAVRLYLFVSLFFFVFLSLTGLALMQFQMVAKPFTVLIDTQGHPYRVEDGEKEPLPQQYADGKPHASINTRISFLTRLGSEHPSIGPEQIADLDARMQRIANKAASKGAWYLTGIAATMHKLATDPGALNGAITAWIPRALFVILPLFAVLLQIFYWRQREFFFVDHLVFSLSFHSFGFALLALAATAAQLLPAAWVGTAMVGALLLYLLLALRRMYAQGWAWTGAKFVVISLVYTVFFLMPAFFIVVALAIFGGEGSHFGA